MRNLAISLKRTGFAVSATAFTVVMAATNLSFLAGQADAAQLTSRTLTLTSTLSGTVATGAANTATNGADATHSFTFTTAGSNDEVDFLYCTTAIGVCTAPGGFSATGTAASVGTATPTGNSIVVAGVSWTAGIHTITLDSITNPTFDNTPTNPEDNTFYVRITTQASNADVDTGTVASSVTQSIDITAKVKETLGFSVTGDKAGVIDPATTNNPACAPLTGSGSIYLGDPTDHTLDFSTSYTNHSYFRIFTNASSGATVQYKGPTLTKPGPVSIAALTSETTAAVGGEQFGLGIDTNPGGGDPNVHDNSDHPTTDSFDQPTFVTGSSNWGQTGYLTLDANYNEAVPGTDKFNFAAGTLTPIASSNGYLLCQTGAVRYVANISPNTQAGIYTTSLVYYAVPTY